MKKSVAVIGSGPAALMLAAWLDPSLFEVQLYEKNQAPGRKFLVAGQGGFNLSHSESLPGFVSRYSPASFMDRLISSFSPDDLRGWLNELGIPTYIGSSKRIFPEKGIKPIEVLNAFRTKIQTNNVKEHYKYEWIGIEPGGDLVFRYENEIVRVNADIVVFALGGASWKVTGSDGNWTSIFLQKGIELVPFEPSNCAVRIAWPETVLNTCEGKALKNISLSVSGKIKQGELVLTRQGLEGGPAYALNPEIRRGLKEKGQVELLVDLKPQLSLEQIRSRLLDKRGTRSWTKQIMDQLNLDETALNLLKGLLSKDEFMDPAILASRLKSLPVIVNGLAPIDEAISTSGGVSLEAIDSFFQLKKWPDHYVIGEMLDWDAPTGGYLLQACLSMGVFLARHLNERFGTREKA